MMAFGPTRPPELIKRFRAEAVSAASLHHPNIVAIHEVGIHEDRHFFVMDYVEGQSLARLVGNQPLPARRAADYVKTIAEAVHYAHERGILHRDLKPSNVLIDAQDQPHVVDFGLARQLEGDSELTVTGQVLGSPQYLPPEQAAGQRGRVSRRTDVYALGATLYHLLTGRPPFQAESLAQTLHLVLHAEPVAPRLLNPSVPARPGNDLPEVPGEGTGPPVSHGPDAWRRNSRVFWRANRSRLAPLARPARPGAGAGANRSWRAWPRWQRCCSCRDSPAWSGSGVRRNPSARGPESC